MRATPWIGLAAIVASVPAQAESARVDAPAGRAADVAATIARQTGTSIVIVDRAVANRKVPAVRGRLEPREAVERLARAAGAQAFPAGPNGWRLVGVQAVRRVPRQRIEPRATEPRPAPVPPPEAPPIEI